MRDNQGGALRGGSFASPSLRRRTILVIFVTSTGFCLWFSSDTSDLYAYRCYIYPPEFSPMTSLYVSAALWVFLMKTRGNSTSLIFFNLPATTAHELAHWLVALVTRSRPGFPSLWPKREEGGWTLGAVQFQANHLTAGYVALAPLLILGPLALWGLCYREPSSWTTELACGIFFGYAAWGSIPSSTDWAIALRYPFGSVFALSALALLGSVLWGA